ncbi:MAG: hypothetical protein H0X31_00055 [Nostocaceae cyanobacterium]|nr:hypothetical protein [Nostocaceae cyanobacterium]
MSSKVRREAIARKTPSQVIKKGDFGSGEKLGVGRSRRRRFAIACQQDLQLA